MRVRVVEGADGASQVVIAERFDTSDVDLVVAIADRLRSRPWCEAVSLDLREAHVVSDYVIARLAADLRHSRGRVSLVGLSQHQHRLLRYLGEEADGG